MYVGSLRWRPVESTVVVGSFVRRSLAWQRLGCAALTSLAFGFGVQVGSAT